VKIEKKIALKFTLNHICSNLPAGQFNLHTFLRAYFYSPSFRVLLNHRIGKHFYFGRGFFLRQISNYYKYALVTKRSCDISYHANIGKNLRLPHPFAIVIGKGVVLGNNVKVFQQVTLGSHGKVGQDFGYPIVGDNTIIYAGATVIGGITIGANSVVGANSLINKDIPAGSVAFGSPCRIRKIE